MDVLDQKGKKTDMVPGRFNSVFNFVPMATLDSDVIMNVTCVGICTAHSATVTSCGFKDEQKNFSSMPTHKLLYRVKTKALHCQTIS